VLAAIRAQGPRWALALMMMLAPALGLAQAPSSPPPVDPPEPARVQNQEREAPPEAREATPAQAGGPTAVEAREQNQEREAQNTAGPRSAPTDQQVCPERYLVLNTAPSVPSDLGREIRTDLAAELIRRGIGVCDQERTAPGPLAVVELELTDASVLRIDLDDRTTDKRVERSLRLTRVPPSGRALAAAIAVDELLRASWAELSLPRAEPEPPPAAQATPELPEVPEPAPRPRRRPGRFLLAATAATTQGTQSWHAFSGGLSFGFWPRAWLWTQLEVLGLRSLRLRRDQGELHVRGAQANALLGLCPWRGQRLFACGGFQVGFDWLSVRARSEDGLTTAHDRSSPGVRLEGVLALGIRLTRHLLLLPQSSFGGSPYAVEASDGQRRLLGTGGFLWTGKLALGVTL
jgi:hypothetical protein